MACVVPRLWVSLGGGGGVVRGFVLWWCGGCGTLPALLCALVDLLFWYILLSVSMSGESWYTTGIFKPQSQFSRLSMLTEFSKLFKVLSYSYINIVL